MVNSWKSHPPPPKAKFPFLVQHKDLVEFRGRLMHPNCAAHAKWLWENITWDMVFDLAKRSRERRIKE